MLRRPESTSAGPRTGLRRSAAWLAVAVVIVIAGCGSSPATGTPVASSPPPSTAASPTVAPGGASPTASESTSDVYRTIEQQVVEIRGLQPKASVDPTVIDDAGIKKLTADSFAKDNPPEVIAANERIMKALGLLPADASLRDLYVKMLGSQVVGLYNPDDKHLYVVSKSGTLGPVEKTTFAHEYTHALQDQNFDLGSLHLDEVGQSDRSGGRLALVEGDAVLSQSLWQAKHLTAAELTELLAISVGDPSTTEFLAMPPVLRESLLFPYVQGGTFVQGLEAGGGWQAVNDAFKRPPASTEQILHPEKYAAGELPIAVHLPTDLASRLGAGWTVGLEDSIGEFELGIWLQSGGAAGRSAAAGWGGDRVAVLNGPNGSWGVVIRTVWDTQADAVEFETAAKPLAQALADPAALLPGAGGTERWLVIGSNAATLGRLTNALGLAG